MHMVCTVCTVCAQVMHRACTSHAQAMLHLLSTCSGVESESQPRASTCSLVSVYVVRCGPVTAALRAIDTPCTLQQVAHHEVHRMVQHTAHCVAAPGPPTRLRRANNIAQRMHCMVQHIWHSQRVTGAPVPRHMPRSPPPL